MSFQRGEGLSAIPCVPSDVVMLLSLKVLQYRDLNLLRKEYPKVPIIALTATAIEQVKNDIVHRLGIKECLFFEQSFNRPNLNYEVRRKNKGFMDDLAKFVTDKHPQQTGVIYCNSIKGTETLAETLQNRYRLSAHHYHGEMQPDKRKAVQEAWQSGHYKIIVATVPQYHRLITNHC